MEEEVFLAIREELAASDPRVKAGKMMSSPAVTVSDKVLAFFSRNRKMVFKLGDQYEPEAADIRPFNPFKKKGPLRGWYEVDFDGSRRWNEFAQQALKIVSQDV